MQYANYDQETEEILLHPLPTKIVEHAQRIEYEEKLVLYWQNCLEN